MRHRRGDSWQVRIRGVGDRFSRNLIHDAPGQMLLPGGPLSMFDANEIFNTGYGAAVRSVCVRYYASVWHACKCNMTARWQSKETATQHGITTTRHHYNNTTIQHTCQVESVSCL